ncbi:glutathione S-transferase family protein [Rhodobium gokarnense]|uniref:Glutathione S-transferase n=1 Tax=Rhodobium gokarnense TaxID=364296 RepID=A0ABT3HH41_9HYPH|nr:glutathione S-transferase family protein [Rhodobium gokarnense]MCW2309649.1 glutathione S-transferase [Rhodobium gokarnense]
MLTLYHQPFSPACRFVRLAIAEHNAESDLIVEPFWERRPEFLKLNPAGELPVLVENDGPAIVGARAIMEYLDETRGYMQESRRLMPDHPEKRAEMRRLVDWFLDKFDREVGGIFVHEKVFKQDMPQRCGGGAPDSAMLRAARANIRPHLRYIGYLASIRNWLAGDRFSYADLAAAAGISCVDYLGEVPWEEDDTAKTWYARVKSRPIFRPLLTEKVRGMPPSRTYADLDF